MKIVCNKQFKKREKIIIKYFLLVIKLITQFLIMFTLQNMIVIFIALQSAIKPSLITYFGALAPKIQAKRDNNGHKKQQRYQGKRLSNNTLIVYEES